MSRRAPFAALAPVFLVSLAAVGFEIALTRYFAVSKWSEYGYWVISIVLAGFAASGVAMALARSFCFRHREALLQFLPAAMVVAAALGFYLASINPFNPLELQNPVTFTGQLWLIGAYYAELIPFYFLAGLYISLAFVLNEDDIGRVYGSDLTGAGMGALAVLGLMFFVHPFLLVPWLLPPLATVAAFAPRHRRRALLLALFTLAGGETLLLVGNGAQINDFKAVYAPLHVPGSRVLASLYSPRGYYQLLDDFTERVNTDVSNDASMLGLPDPPRTYGLYRDGDRLASIPRTAPLAGYASATLSALPYRLEPNARVLLVGSSGGWRIAEARALGAARIMALEPEPVLFAALRRGLGPAPPFPFEPGVHVSREGPIAATAAGGQWNLIDIASDFLNEAPANDSAFAVEAIAGYVRALAPGGIVSIPVSIREFPAYAVRMLATARAALLAAGVKDVPAHVLVIRSAWNVRILLSRQPFRADEIATARKFCDDLSFDVSYYPGIDVEKARENIYNDLPAVSFTTGRIVPHAGLDDAIADEALAVLKGKPTPSGAAFNLSPITFNRPAYYAVLRLEQLGSILKRIQILPQAELGPLVTLAVLAQAIVVALLVLTLPLLAGARFRGTGVPWARAGGYFAALGLGFFAIEIVLIEHASFLFDDRTLGFAVVISGMLVCSGLGSMLADRFDGRERHGMVLAAVVILAWCGFMLAFLQPILLAALALPLPARVALLLALLAPVSVALGLPFPLGLARLRGGPFLPWAWGLNGAFSVVATPLATLIATEAGYDQVLALAFLLYACAMMLFPPSRRGIRDRV